jgi:hypothetical protein
MNMNLKTHKHLITLTLALLLLSSLFVGVAFAFKSGASSVSGADYVVLEGVAGNDYYDGRQYSYNINQWAYDTYYVPDDGGEYPAPNPANWWFNANKSLRLAMTEYGEFATPSTAQSGPQAGIAYGYNAAEWTQTESWAAMAINPALYIQGWVFYMNYTRAALPRALEAYAIYSDTSTSESARKVYSWVGDRASNAVGAQLTAGSLVTSGVQVLYDSARLVAGRTSITILDGAHSNEQVAKITLTVVFNKDTKYATIYKDVKILLDPKILDEIKDISFGERYELDLARGDNTVNPSNQAWVHYYGAYDNSTYQHPVTGDTQYDVVQAFNPAKNYTYFAAYWPNATEYSVYDPLVPDLPNGYTRVLPNGRQVADIPSPPGEPNTPWIFAQWRYNNTMYRNLCNFLAKAAQREIRFVEVVGMTDYNWGSTAYAPWRAQDANEFQGAINNVDMEVQFLLNNVFNPEDLNSVDDESFMWIGVGQPSMAVDSLGAAFLYDYNDVSAEPMAFFDKNDTAGTIPYGLSGVGNFATNYVETFSNSGKGTGTDTTTYKRTGLMGFAFYYYDGTTGRTPPQPIAGGRSYVLPGYWYPSKDPLTERWTANSALTSFASSQYDGIAYSPNGIITVGGPKANQLSRYFNDMNFAIDREGTTAYALVNGGSVTGTAPTSDASIGTFDFFPLSSWASSMSTFSYTSGYAVISVARDLNGTRGFSVYGWDGRDSYWAAAWASQMMGDYDGWIPDGCTAIILQITYNGANREPTAFTVVKALGTITEFGYNSFASMYGFDNVADSWTGYVQSDTAVPVTVPFDNWSYEVWWWEKLPTTSTATVQFDP